MKKTFCIVLFIAFPLYVTGMQQTETRQREGSGKLIKFIKFLSYGLKAGDSILSDIFFFMPGGGVNAESKYHQFKERIERLAATRAPRVLNLHQLTIN